MSRMLDLVYSRDRRAVCVYRGLPQMPPEQRAVWTTWLTRHGLDPNEVLLGTEIRCDDEERRVYYTSLDREAIQRGERDVITMDRYVQLEAPALPFPS
jgi:hypothetical protein